MSGQLVIVPMVWRDAADFVDTHHRHHRRPAGMKFCLALADTDRGTDGDADTAGDTIGSGGRIVGVAIVGRPVARHFDDGWTLEVTRCCLSAAGTGARNGNSMLYGACWRATKALGYRRLIAYTQAGESGASLRGAGWHVVAQRPPHRGWNRPSRPRPTSSNEPVARTLWEPAPSTPKSGPGPLRPRASGARR